MPCVSSDLSSSPRSRTPRSGAAAASSRRRGSGCVDSRVHRCRSPSPRRPSAQAQAPATPAQARRPAAAFGWSRRRRPACRGPRRRPRPGPRHGRRSQRSAAAVGHREDPRYAHFSKGGPRERARAPTSFSANARWPTAFSARLAPTGARCGPRRRPRRRWAAARRRRSSQQRRRRTRRSERRRGRASTARRQPGVRGPWPRPEEAGSYRLLREREGVMSAKEVSCRRPRRPVQAPEGSEALSRWRGPLGAGCAAARARARAAPGRRI